MLDMIKDDCRPVSFAEPNDITLGELQRFLGAYAAHPLVFFYEGQPVKPGYHVTEVKAGQFNALDCGANPESWTEISVQLWDVDEGERTHMPAGKFAAIVRKVSEHVGLEPSARLTFVVSDGVRAVHIDLSPRPASCKPRDRWLEEQQAAACCGSSKAQPCCA